MDNQDQSKEIMITTSSLMELCGNTKADRQLFADHIVLSVKEGLIDPLRMHIMVKNTESLLELIKDNKEYKNLCLSEASKYGKKFNKENATFEIKEVGVKYDYSRCNDQEYIKLQEEKAILEAKIKKREVFLKSIPESGHEARCEDELITIYPPLKTSKTAITVSLK